MQPTSRVLVLCILLLFGALAACAPAADPTPAATPAPVDLNPDQVFTQPVFSPVDDRLLVQHGTRSAAGEITRYALSILNPETRQLRPIQLPAGTDSVFQPNWLPDGRSVVYVAFGANRDARIYLNDLDSGERIIIGERLGAGATYVRVANTRPELAFRHEPDAFTSDVYTVSVTAPDEVTNRTADFDPLIVDFAYAPDDRFLALATLDLSGESGVHLLDLETGDIERITQASATRVGFAAERLVFDASGVENGELRSEVVFYDPADETTYNLTNTPALQEVNPLVNPNGDAVAYLVFTDDSNAPSPQILRVQSFETFDGDAATQIGLPACLVRAYSWSSDGERIAYDCQIGGAVDIRVAGRDGSNDVNLTTR